MNLHKLKIYAPQARSDFIKAVKDQANHYGLTSDKIEPIIEQGDIAIIAGKPFARAVAEKRKKLERRIENQGFEQLMEAMAYTWFNRFVAIRYMELHGYLDHGYRILSHPHGNNTPEILEHAEHVDLPELNRDKIIELKLEGTKEAELYRMLLIGQCNALNKAMPFLFQKIVDDETELLLPGNLLHSNSIVRKLVNEIPEEDWQEVELIGWLYQFYISEKKAQVIGKVVKSEDIPAATQLFTPNWIVKYMVQNTLGHQWITTYPNSPLKGQMEYYIEPAEQTPEVLEQLKAITPDSLNPEKLTLLDPACGSGHILIEAYDLLKTIYKELGYRAKDIPRLILQKNLYGLEIDGRAAQLTGFAMMMKGRADDQRLFERGVKLNVMAFQDSSGFDADALAQRVDLSSYGMKLEDLKLLKALFEHATTFGSLIQVSDDLALKLPALKKLSEATSQDLFVSDALKRLSPLVQQVEMLAAQYDAVVANPPYMGGGGMNALVKKFAKDNYPDARSDLFSCFIERGFTLAKEAGHNAMVTMQSWMFLSSFERMRTRMLREKTIRTMAHLGARAFSSISGEIVQTTATVLQNQAPQGDRPVFFRLLDGGEAEKREALKSGDRRHDRYTQGSIASIPGAAVVYWAGERTMECLSDMPTLANYAFSKGKNVTGDNIAYQRWFWEVNATEVGPEQRWVFISKGGGFRKWVEHRGITIDWSSPARNRYASRSGASIIAQEFWFVPGVSWGLISTVTASFRALDEWHTFSDLGLFTDPTSRSVQVLALLNSVVGSHFLSLLNPTINFPMETILRVPFAEIDSVVGVSALVEALRQQSLASLSGDETHFGFEKLPLECAPSPLTATLESSYTTWITQNRDTIAEMKRLEEENNRLFIDAYGLADELTPDVPIEQITLTVNPAYRYGCKLTEEEQRTRFREDTMQELISFAIGCMMGRYSLDEPGLVYAHSGNDGFDPSRYSSFPADDDGIVPITDTEWFDDDAAHRFEKFIATAWPEKHLDENLRFIAESIGPKRNESPRDTIRRYLASGFYKHHLTIYKKRPIYWLFSSGKAKAFECLVYLHRYNEGTLSRMRTEYVIPLQGKISARIEQLNEDITSASSTSHRKKCEKERDKLTKQQAELHSFDDKLRHFADKRISLDLDDGVKVNYGKFGDLLADVKAVHGKKSKE